MKLTDILNTRCCLAGTGTTIAAIGLILAISWPNIFESILYQDIKLAPDSRSYGIWKDPPIPLSLDIYLYNWTNPEDLTNHSTKPILVQLGPYRFTEKTDKVNISWHPENATISFFKKSNFWFDEAGSMGSLDDMVTTLNVVAMGALEKARHWSYLQQKSVEIGLKLYNQERHVTKSARELLFDGYQDNMIDMAREMPFFGGEEITIPFDRFGWFYTRNGSAELTGFFNMNTGGNNISDIGVLENWNYHSHTRFFEGSCARVNGSAGEFYPPKQTRTKPISFFSPDLCRSVAFDYEEDVSIHGINGYKFTGGARSLDNGTIFPENECFCNGECLASGVFNISACRYNTPVFMSYPHFYGADSLYADRVVGMTPSKDKHQFYLVLEPETGIVLDVAARFQVNIMIRPVENIAQYAEVPRIVFPVIWFEQRASMPIEMADEMKMALTLPTVGVISGYVLIVIGLVIALWLPLRWYIRDRNQSAAAQKTNRKIEEIDMLKKTPEISPLILSNGHFINCADKKNGMDPNQ